MIPAPAGTVAYFVGPSYPGDDPNSDHEVPVVAFSEDGVALVCTDRGHLVEAANYYRKGWRFQAVYVPTNDPVVHVERTDGPVAIDTAGGLDEAVGFVYRASGAVTPILDSEGTPWTYIDEWKPWAPSARDLGAA